MALKNEDLAAWIREEHDKVRDVAGRLQERVAVVPRTNLSRWIQGTTEAFDHFRAHLVKHMALEEQDGYMVPVSEARPALAREVDRLAHEHTEVTRIMDSIHQALHELRPEDRLLMLDVCRRIQSLLEFVEHHEKDENLLVLSVYTTDIGTKD